jgi:hypothetical protein
MCFFYFFLQKGSIFLSNRHNYFFFKNVSIFIFTTLLTKRSFDFQYFLQFRHKIGQIISKKATFPPLIVYFLWFRITLFGFDGYDVTHCFSLWSLSTNQEPVFLLNTHFRPIKSRVALSFASSTRIVLVCFINLF